MKNYVITLKEDTNLLDYSDWNHEFQVTGSTNSFYPYNFSGGTNYIIQDTDPFGDIKYLWYANTSGGTDMSAGFNSSPIYSPFINIDNTKNYRMSCWVKQKTLCSSGELYLSHQAFSGTTSVTLNDLSGQPQTSWSYHTNADLQTIFPVGEWRLCVCHFKNVNWTGTTNNAESGIWSRTTKITGITYGDIKFQSLGGGQPDSCDRILLRVLFPKSETGGGTGEICYPRIDCVDGTEPSIETLLRSEGIKEKILIKGTGEVLTT